jgi:HTH-type transcriptional regulator, sugar sensing transcriptional regulator
MTPLKSLLDIGLDEKEAAFYLAALEHGQGTVRELAEAAGITRTNAYDVLNRLMRRGLLALFETDSPKRTFVVAEEPTRLAEMVAERQRIVDGALPELRALYNQTHARPRIRFYQGDDGVRSVMAATLHSRSDLVGILSVQDLLVSPGREYMSSYVEQRVARGLALKVVRSRETEAEAMWRTDRDALREVRLAPAGQVFSMTMLVHDDVVSIIASRRENFGLTIESHEFAVTQRNLFETLWSASRPDDQRDE